MALLSRARSRASGPAGPRVAAFRQWRNARTRSSISIYRYALKNSGRSESIRIPALLMYTAVLVIRFRHTKNPRIENFSLNSLRRQKCTNNIFKLRVNVTRVYITYSKQCACLLLDADISRRVFCRSVLSAEIRIHKNVLGSKFS